jgi:cytochrome c biogenesis protein CcmG/thiol:disulfide interchange protein DsbE
MLRYVIPLGIFVGLVALFAVGLFRDPKLVPSPFIGKPAPEFSLPTLQDPKQSFGRNDLLGKVSLVNVWATWCVSCRQEHGLLMQVAQRADIQLVGFDYKDERPAALEWLQAYGDPYSVVVFDENGRAGINWGVYGTPETFVVDPKGIVRYKFVGPLTPDAWQEFIEPVLAQIRTNKG